MSVARTSAQGESIDATLFALTGVGGSFRGHRPWSHHDALTMTDERVCVWTISRGSKTLAGVADWLPDMSPKAAVEVLSERGLWPWAPGDVNAPRWFCEECQGTRLVGGGWVGTEYQDTDLCETCGREDLDATGGVTADGTTADPPSLAALVAVASLGAATLRRVAELVRELRASTSQRVECDECRGWGGYTITTGDGSHGTLEQESCEGCGGAGEVTSYEVGATLTWRVMAREDLVQRYVNVTPKASVTTVADVWDVEMLAYADAVAWPEECPRIYEDRPHLVAAWPALRALAVHEDGKTPTGLHLVDATPERVVIAVESV